ncbi:CDP-diacylglycerol--glycerol-3-phosphate 3-phosphatidyltransferase [Natranaerofaba carboxydovora]|uniref:CDP-diacylglycerol--glycerol-3-phosphate 3-phosphatidyltransferase n=1 Tax=Natranaerofaba carboxydovora TaxID=2742683 RepID=UPI001F140FDA|nr:CDP-diacylglycerol--glycerol-3-phosphate 3-phosphatidyltransferase [Natranaerofaba carboxydovora]UMZ73472.1 CDP-diacylglycerol--glycerol-3-phosphate 3-phosphatidyltransferase [Natranaerofaba carboxydovora]
MNLANKITIARIILAPLFMIFLLMRLPYGEFVALGLFVIASATDALDGYIARSRKQITNFGKFLDPLADKMLVLAALIALVGMDKLHPFIAFVIIGREFAVTGLRVIAAGENIVISASKLGKLKTITQIVAISALMFQAGLESAWSTASEELVSMGLLVNISLVLAVVITIVSGVDYFYKNKDVIKLGK